jgi:hypothetical protein
MVILDGPMKSHRAQPSVDGGLPPAMASPMTRTQADRPSRAATHWHFYRFTREAIAGRLRTYSSG